MRDRNRLQHCSSSVRVHSHSGVLVEFSPIFRSMRTESEPPGEGLHFLNYILISDELAWMMPNVRSVDRLIRAALIQPMPFFG